MDFEGKKNMKNVTKVTKVTIWKCKKPSKIKGLRGVRTGFDSLIPCSIRALKQLILLGFKALFILFVSKRNTKGTDL